MSTEREPTFIAAVGMTGVGKTYENLKQIRSVVLGNSANGVPPRKTLIIDNNMEYRNDNKDVMAVLHPYGIGIKTIHYRDVPIFTRQRQIEVCRVIPVDDNGAMLAGKKFGTTLNSVLENFMGGFIVAEDFKAIAGNSLNEELLSLLVTRRHKGCDTLVSLQSLRMIQPALMAVLKWIRMHQITGFIKSSDEKFDSYIQMINIAKNMVNNRYKLGGEHERFFVKIQLQKSFMMGVYSQNEFIHACRQYIFENYSQTVKKKMQWRDDSGKKMFTEETALRELLNEYSAQYSQYSPRYQKPAQ